MDKIAFEKEMLAQKIQTVQNEVDQNRQKTF